MKKICLFAIATLSIVASCTKNEDIVKALEFTGEILDNSTKTTLDGNKVKWELNDEVTINSAIYKVASIDANGKALFQYVSGTVPTAPYSASYGTEPTAVQTYTETPGKMYMTAPSTATPSLQFSVQCAAMKITLEATSGKSFTDVIVKGSSSSYTVHSDSPIDLSSAKTVYVFVPAGTYNNYEVRNANNTTGVKKSSSSDITVAANHIKPVSLKSLTFVPYYPGAEDKDCIDINGVYWAPMNCGYEPATTSPAYKGYPYGKLYQWGRKDGQGYDSNDATYPSGDNLVSGPISYIPGSSDAEKFYKVSTGQSNWYNGTAPNELWGESKTTYDPCPKGWRVPTKSELEALKANKSEWTTKDGQKGYYFSGSVSYSESAKRIFLPAAGFSYGNGNKSSRGSYGYYWSSKANSNKASVLYFGESSVSMYDNNCACGYSVRCVHE